MNFIETLLIGSYLYTSAIFGFLWRLIEKRHAALLSNHLKHTEEALNEVRIKVGLPTVKLTKDA